MSDNNFIAQQGWQCPICKTVYSPTTPMCYYCGQNGMSKTSTTTQTGTVDVDWLKQQGTTYTSVCTGTCYGRDTFSAEDLREVKNRENRPSS